MAKMFPSRPVEGAPASEAKVFEALRDGLPDSFLVIHGRRVVLPGTEQRALREAEVDFVVLDPDHGIIGLEVKGGQVGRDQDGWYSVSSGGRRHELTRDPGLQARRAIGALVKYLQGRTATRALGRLHWSWGVVLPAVEVRGDLDPALPRSAVIDVIDLADPRSALRRVHRANSFGVTALDHASQRLLLKEIAPSFQLVPTLATRFLDEAPLLVRLTEEQMSVLDFFEDCRRVSVQGPAGCGKTLVGLEKARRLAASGARTLYLCFNQPLADHIARRSDEFQVSTFHKLCSRLCKAAGIRWDPPREGEGVQGFFAEEAPGLLEKALDRLPDERFDAVIVDEGQDFHELWWIVVEKLLKNPEQSYLYVFHDPNQDIYGGGPADAFRLTTATLKYNCRNTHRIAEYAFGFVGSSPVMKPDSPEGIEVTLRDYGSPKEEVDLLARTLHDLVRNQGVEEKRIVVLSTRSAEASPIGKAGRLGNFELVGLDVDPRPNQVRFGSLYRFKGLDEDVVILCDVEPGMETEKARELYVGTSRARLALTVLRARS